MGILSRKIFQSVDDLYYLQASNKTCSAILEEELFDGEKYAIDEFYEKHKVHFDHPEGFYTDFPHAGALDLKEGFHFSATDIKDAAKYEYRPMLFDSPVVTSWPENNLVPLRWFCNTKKKSSVLLLFSPGWARPNLTAEKIFCARLMNKGVDAALLSVPYHQERAPKGSYSGQYFISSHVFRTVENFRHYVAEIRRLIQYMRQQYDYIGIIGMSSGGFQAGLAITAEPVDFYFPFITAAKLGSVLWESKISRFIKKGLISKGIDEADTNKVWAIADQLFVGHHIKATHIKQYISLYDKIVPTRYQFMLWDIYNRPEKLELECAHISIAFFMNKVADDIIEYVKNKIAS